MIKFIGYLFPCILFAYLFFTKRKTYSLFLLLFYILNFLGIFVLHNLSNMQSNIFFTIETPLLIIGIVLFYRDYKQNKK